MEMCTGKAVGSETPVADQITSPPIVAKLRVASLFSGIGGFDLAFDIEGAEVVFQCERDAYCRAVLRRHWHKATISDDILSLQPADIPDADIWTAGFPCQDVSLARGNHGRNGLKGDHTSLFFRLMELVAVKKPKVILLENVVGLLNSHKGQDFAVILGELTQHGYAVAWRVMNARYFGAPQSRARVFLCAWRGDYQRAVTTLFENLPGAAIGRERTGFVTQSVHKRTGAIVPTVAYCVAATSGRHTGNDWSRSYISYPDGVRRPTPTESERLQGFPAGWTIPAATFAPPARGLDSDRYKAAGNAVAVPVVQWIAKRLIAQLSSVPPPSAPTTFLKNVSEIAPDLGGKHSELDFDQIDPLVVAGQFVHRWKSGGCAWGKSILEGMASPAPSKIIPSSFVDALDEDVPDDRYFLTANAAVGILRRADVVGRNLFPPMRKALENLVRQTKGSDKSEPLTTGEPFGQSRLRPSWSEQRGQVELIGAGAERRLSGTD